TRAVSGRRWLDPETASDLGALDLAAIDRVREEVWPQVDRADELHDALVELGFITPGEGRDWVHFLDELAADRRAAVYHTRTGGPDLWVAAERLPQLNAIFADARTEPHIVAPAALSETSWSSESALVEIVRGRLEGLGPVPVQTLADSLGLSAAMIEQALVSLEVEGFVFRGRFTPGLQETEWCARRLLARIHSYTLNRLRQEIEPVSSADFVRFLLAWQKLGPDHQVEGPESVAGLIDQLEGFEAPAAAWEGEILPARMADYDPAWLDSLCLSGQVLWARLTAPKNGTERAKASGPVRTTPISLLNRKDAALWNSLFPGTARDEVTLSSSAEAVYGL